MRFKRIFCTSQIGHRMSHRMFRHVVVMLYGVGTVVVMMNCGMGIAVMRMFHGVLR